MKGVTPDLFRPGKPPDNSFVEAVEGTVGAALDNEYLFLSLADARAKYEAFTHYVQTERPKTSIGTKLRRPSSIPSEPPPNAGLIEREIRPRGGPAFAASQMSENIALRLTRCWDRTEEEI